MPPKFKTSKQEILAASIEIVKKSGFAKLTAREIGRSLQLSSRPIYSFYPSLSDLKDDVLKAIGHSYQTFLQDSYSHDIFLNIGIGQIIFARQEPELYRVLHEHIDGSVLEHFSLKDTFIKEMKKHEPYSGLADAVLSDLLFKMGVFTDGLALAVSRGLELKTQDIKKILSETGTALIEYAFKSIRR